METLQEACEPMVPLLLSLAGAAVMAAPPEILPPVGPSRDTPRWVAESVAVGPGGLNHEYFETTDVEQLEASVAAARNAAERSGTDPGDDCAVWSTFTYDRVDGEPRNSLGALVRDAKNITAGRVIGSDQGFYLGHPGTLLEIEVTRVHGSSAGARAPQKYLVFYQYAQIAVDDTLLCSRPERGDPPPEVGARVLIFESGTFPADPTSGSQDALLPLPNHEEFLFESEGMVSIPGNLSDLPRRLPFDDLDSMVVELTRNNAPAGG